MIKWLHSKMSKAKDSFIGFENPNGKKLIGSLRSVFSVGDLYSVTRCFIDPNEEHVDICILNAEELKELVDLKFYFLLDAPLNLSKNTVVLYQSSENDLLNDFISYSEHYDLRWIKKGNFNIIFGDKEKVTNYLINLLLNLRNILALELAQLIKLESSNDFKEAWKKFIFQGNRELIRDLSGTSALVNGEKDNLFQALYWICLQFNGDSIGFSNFGKHLTGLNTQEELLKFISNLKKTIVTTYARV